MKTFYPTYDNDLALARNKRGKLDLVMESDNVVVGAIKLYHRFQFFEGEWFLDTREGVPWFRLILVKNPNLNVIRAIFRKVILSVKTIATVDTMEFDFDKARRTLGFTFTATAVDGRPIAGGTGAPFIVDGKPIQYTESSAT